MHINPFTHQTRTWYPYHNPTDPCPPIKKKSYYVPPSEFLGFQPPNLPQFSPEEALHRGTLWPILLSPYEKSQKREGQ